jgi:hypothetical protein
MINIRNGFGLVSRTSSTELWGLGDTDFNVIRAGVFGIATFTARDMMFATNNTERMRIFSDGNVFIGSSPSNANFKLDVNGTGRFSDSMTIATPSNAVSIILNGRSSDNANAIRFNSNSSALINSILSTSSNFFLSSNGNTPITFVTNDSGGGGTRMTINGSGTVTLNSLGTGTVYSSGGTLTNTNPSDLNLKNNVEPINYGLGEILKLNPVSFDWKNDKINQGKQYGFIAQEVQKIMPDLVKQGEYLGLDKEAIFTTLVKAIQELKQEIDNLKS